MLKRSELKDMISPSSVSIQAVSVLRLPIGILCLDTILKKA